PVELRIALAVAEAGAVRLEGRAIAEHDVGFEGAESALPHLLCETREVVVALHPRHAQELGVTRAVAAAVRPVERNARSYRAAEESVHRHTERLALDVEQCVLDRRHRLAVDASSGLDGPGAQVRVDELDLTWILA